MSRAWAGMDESRGLEKPWSVHENQMKTIILSIMLTAGRLFGGQDWPADQLPKGYVTEKIKNADEIVWWSPAYKKEREYSEIQIPAGKIGELSAIFLDARPGNAVDSLLTEGTGRKDNGYLVFRKGGEVVAVFQVEPSVTDRKSVRWCELLVQEDGIRVVMRRGGLGQALVFPVDYRKKLFEAVDAADAGKRALFKVYVCKDNKL
jgi:hypothetical protein